MKFLTKYISGTMAALLVGVALSSCSDDIFMGENEQLPPGSYPLKLTASVEGLKSRSSDADPWVDGDLIRVQIADFPRFGCYELNASGTVSNIKEIIEWPQPYADVKGWYPYEAPESIADQSAGNHPFDLMYAFVENGHYRSTIGLTFKHLMSKVSCTLVQGDDLSDEEFKSAVVKFYGNTRASFSEDGTSVEGDVPGRITPCKNSDVELPDYDSMTSDFSAMLVPHDMTGQEFIEITLNVKINNVLTPRRFIYTPESAELQAGMHYRYVITVRKERIVVQQGSWIEDWEAANDNPEGIHNAVFRVNMPWADNASAYKPNIVFTSFSNNVRACDTDNNVLDPADGLGPDDVDHFLVGGNDFEFTYTMVPDETASSTHDETRAFLAEDEDIFSMSRTSTLKGDSFTDENAYFEITQKMSLRSRNIKLTYDLYAEVGDFYYSDGTWLSELIDSADKYCIGLVFHSGPGPRDDIEYYSGDATFVDWLTDEDGNRIRKKKITGYVLSLHDAKMDNSYTSDPDYPYYKSKDDYKNDPYVQRPYRISFSDMGLTDIAEIYQIFCGFIGVSGYVGQYVCKNLYQRLINSYNSEKMYRLRTIPYQACIEYNYTWDGGSVSTPAGSSGWYLPSFRQIYDAYKIPERVKKFEAISNTQNKVDEVSDFVMDKDFDVTDNTIYNTISYDKIKTSTQRLYMFFSPSPLLGWYCSVNYIDLEDTSASAAPTHTRPILTF